MLPIMRTEVGPVACAVVAGCLAAALPASAQETDSVTVDVGECTDLESPEERLACYEAQVEAELKRRDSEAAATAPERPADAAPPPPRTETRDTDQPAAAPEAEPVEIVGTVASVRETIPNNYTITLEDGQIWRQTYPKKYPLRAGHRVTIYPTRWGSSFRLESDSVRGYIQVERVR
jgi:hypothetical protein